MGPADIYFQRILMIFLTPSALLIIACVTFFQCWWKYNFWPRTGNFKNKPTSSRKINILSIAPLNWLKFHKRVRWTNLFPQLMKPDIFSLLILWAVDWNIAGRELFIMAASFHWNWFKMQGQCRDVFSSSVTKRIEYYDVALNQFSIASHSHTAV